MSLQNTIQCLKTGILGVNTYITMFLSADGKKQAFVVDPGGNTSSIIEILTSNNAELVGIVLTHGHFDHVGALAGLKEAYAQAVVCVHKDDAKYIGATGYDMHRNMFAMIGFSDPSFFTHDAMPEADYFLEDGMLLSFHKDWKIIYTPGHSEGSICIYNEKEKILFSGDTLFANSYGRTDLPDGSFTKLKKSLHSLLQLPYDVVVYPGHEGATTIGQEQWVI